MPNRNNTPRPPSATTPETPPEYIYINEEPPSRQEEPDQPGRRIPGRDIWEASTQIPTEPTPQGAEENYQNRLRKPGTNRTSIYPIPVNIDAQREFNEKLEHNLRNAYSVVFKPTSHIHKETYQVYIPRRPENNQAYTTRHDFPDYYKTYRNKQPHRKSFSPAEAEQYRQQGIDTFYCALCNRETPAQPSHRFETIYEGRAVCYNCASVFKQCENCGKHYYQPKNKYSILGHDCDSINYCPDCAGKVTACKLCKTLHPINFKAYDTGKIKHYTDEPLICRDCFTANLKKCYACGKVIFVNNSYCVGDYYFCKTCYDERYYTCPICHYYCYPNREGQTPGIYDTKDGRACQKCYARQYAPVKQYNFIPDLTMHQEATDAGTRLYMGIELEIENTRRKHNNDHIAERIAELYPFCYCMRDGSLNSGFEITTHPFTYAYFKEHAGDFKRLLTYCKRAGYTSYNPGTCGIHIHLSKNAFTHCHLYKFIKLFYEKKNFDFLKTISQRDHDSTQSCCQWGSSYEISDPIDLEEVVKEKVKYGKRSGKYTAINMNHPRTVEVRIFRGTLNYNSFVKNIEFIASLYDFTRDNSFKDVTVNKYLEYIEKNRRENRHLYNFLIDNRVITGSKLSYNANHNTAKGKEI